jgi:hypothetical protein
VSWENTDYKALKNLLKEVVREVIREEKIPRCILATIKSIQTVDGKVTYTCTIIGDDTEISGVISKTAESLNVGDNVELFAKKGNLSDSFIFVKHAGSLQLGDIFSSFTPDDVLAGDNVTIDRADGKVTINSSGGSNLSAENVWTEGTESFNIFRGIVDNVLKFGAIASGNGITFTKNGDVLSIGSDVAGLPANGSEGQILKMVSGVPTWVNSEGVALLKQPEYTTGFPFPPFDNPLTTMTPINNITINYTYVIT